MLLFVVHAFSPYKIDQVIFRAQKSCLVELLMPETVKQLQR